MLNYLILFFILFVFLLYTYYRSSYVKIKASDNNYYIIRNLNPKLQHESVEVLSKINSNIIALIDYIKNNFPNQNWIVILDKNFKRNGQSLSEAPVENGFTSYTVDKEFMHICLRTRDSSQDLYDLNTLMYVVIHELAHMGNYDSNNYPIEGHGPEFIQKFQFLLKNAIKMGIYSFQDYTQKPQEYCGITIDKSILS